MFNSIKDWCSNICVPPFTDKEIANNIHKAKVRESNKWDKHLAGKGYCRRSGIFAYYDMLLKAGYVQSRVSYGARKGELCLYNRKTDNTIFAEDY